jgi:hypothetical protein
LKDSNEMESSIKTSATAVSTMVTVNKLLLIKVGLNRSNN